MIKQTMIARKTTQFATISMLLAILSFCFSTQLCAEGIEIEKASITLADDVYQLNANINFKFTEQAIEALEHGVSLFINIDIKTERQRRYLWNEVVSNRTIFYRLEYHPLSQRYLLTELNRSIRQDFRYLGSALSYLGEVKNWPLFQKSILDEDENYQTLIRAKLDIQSLPAPLRPIAFISSNWQISSEWQQAKTES